MISIVQNKTMCQRVRRTKNNDEFFTEIPYVKWKLFYTKNKKCKEEYKKMVEALEQEQVLREKYAVKNEK